MSSGGGFEYAQARLQARLARRAGPAAWARLDALRGIAAFVEAARGALPEISALSLTADTPAHEIERRLGERWLDTVRDVARWLPEAWRDAVDWCRVLPWLPAAAHALRVDAGSAWPGDDPLLGPVLRVPRAQRAAMLREGPFAPIADALAHPREVLVAWRNAWRRTLPAMSEEAALALSDVERRVARHWSGFVRASPARAWPLRRELASELVLCIRRHALSPAPAFAYLALSAIDLERLRGALVGRILFGSPTR